MFEIIANVNSAIKRELETGVGDIDSIHRHLERLETVVWWLFCKHRRADYIDAGGAREILDEYERLDRAGERDWAGERELERERARARLQYDQNVVDTASPDGEEPCVVCLNSRRIVTAVPCMHKVMCGFCAAALFLDTLPDDSTGLHLCPMCRTPIQYCEIRSETKQ